MKTKLIIATLFASLFATLFASLFISMCASILSPVFAAVEHLPDEQSMPADQRELFEIGPARQYMLKLINKDRASVGAKPVELDEIASKAGQLHSDEMAINGYLSHWTMDGKKPDQRYNDVGGNNAIMENAYVSLEGDAYDKSKDPNKLPLHAVQAFHRYELDQIEQSFFNEKPPNDGHRVNIIDPHHTSVGIGLSFSSQFGMGTRTACAQEFVNHYGEAGSIPKTVSAGTSFPFGGELQKGVSLKSIDIRWEALPKPMTIAELSKTYSYSYPDKIITSYFADPSQTDDPIKVKKVDDHEVYSVNIATDKEWEPGLYYITIWATVDGGAEAVVSGRTFELTSSQAK